MQMRKRLSGLCAEWNCPLIKCHAMKMFRGVDTDPSIFIPDTKQTRVANFTPRSLCPWDVMPYVHSPCVSRPKDLYSSNILYPLFYFCVSVHRSMSQIKHQLDTTLCRFYFYRVTLHVSGVKRPSSGVLKIWHGGPWYRCYSCRSVITSPY